MVSSAHLTPTFHFYVSMAAVLYNTASQLRSGLVSHTVYFADDFLIHLASDSICVIEWGENIKSAHILLWRFTTMFYIFVAILYLDKGFIKVVSSFAKT